MAEVLAVVSSIVEFLTLCNDGFTLIKGLVEAKEKMGEQLMRIETQHGHFLSWSEIWGTSQNGQKSRFQQYADDHPASSREILRQLALFSRLFYDLKALEKYGIKITDTSDKSVKTLEDFHFESEVDLSPQKLRRFRASCDANMSLMKRPKFVLWGREKRLEDLISRLREYNEVLWRYGPAGVQVARLDKGVYDNIGQVVAEQLGIVLASYKLEAESATDPASARRYLALAKMANFRAQVRRIPGGTTMPRIFQANDLYIRDNYKVDSRGISTMALLRNFSQQGDLRVVLIEWIQNPQLPNKRQEAEWLAALLSAPKPDEMLVPDCYGVLDDITQTNRLGIIMRPPDNISRTTTSALPPGAISERRMPVSLRQLIKGRLSPLYASAVTLGTKFNIAKHIVDTVHMIHAAEWVHKAAIFFPEGEICDSLSSNPLLVGFNNARMSRTAALNLTLDYYQHRAKLADPSVPYRRLYDLYSLGCVLLDLGLWGMLDDLIQFDGDGSEPSTAAQIHRLASESNLDR
ncbi:hypothetical protein B0H63DRAFT_500687 [Podospora didyma]|uniref:Prion-inhibition and propagation HeLo domain-containing protein n=1 Tax=Podospora didyma TaxID=330526 RepID=A0AAE0NTK7_9PEZI|nr:hypothetical protein B0H63DRAFT_500687 [Podospora didyma]